MKRINFDSDRLTSLAGYFIQLFFLWVLGRSFIYKDSQAFPNTTRKQETELSSRGVAHYRLKTEGFGQDKPLVRNNPAAWAKNRRVEIEED